VFDRQLFDSSAFTNEDRENLDGTLRSISLLSIQIGFSGLSRRLLTAFSFAKPTHQTYKTFTLFEAILSSINLLNWRRERLLQRLCGIPLL
jgi:hypothetical protein